MNRTQAETIVPSTPSIDTADERYQSEGGQRPPSLQTLISPLEQDAFLSTYYGQQHCHFPGDDARFTAIAPWEDINALLRRQRLPTPRIDLTRDGATLPTDSYTQEIASPRGRLRQLDVEALNAHLRDGATLVVNSLDQELPAVRRLGRILEQELGAFVSANAYLSWGTTHGFDVHWDDHDTFVVQVHGRKHWSLYGPTRPHPLHDDLTQPVRPQHEPIEERILTAGDILYVPRGCWHDVTAVGEPSLHITFALLTTTGADFLAWAAHQAKSDVNVRLSLPRAQSPQARAAYVSSMHQAIAANLDVSALERFLAELEFTGRVDPSPTLPSITALGATGRGDIVRGSRSMGARGCPPSVGGVQ
jgi:ribosomal protein L16 Arg81 hydroxylase